MDQLSGSLGKIIPTAAAFGVNIEQLGASLALMTASGISTAESSTYLNSALNELGKSGTKASDTLVKMSGKTFTELIKEGKSLGDIFALMSLYADKNNLSMADLFGSSEAAKAGLVLAKDAGVQFNDALKEMVNSTGATEKAFATMDDTIGNKMTKAFNNLKNSFLEAGDSLAPTIEKIAGGVSKMADTIAGMDSNTIASIATLGALGVALGGILGVVGNITSGIGGMMTVFGKLATSFGTTQVAAQVASAGMTGVATSTTVATTSLGALSGVLLPVAAVLGTVALGWATYKEAQDLANSDISRTTDNMNVLERTINTLSGGIFKSKEELQSMGVLYKDFNENISDKFQQKVEESTKALHNMSVSISEMNFDGIITEEEVASFGSQVNTLVDGVISTIESRKEEVNGSMKGMFADDGVITESEKKVLDYLNRNFDTQVTETNKLKEEINAIIAKANEEKRQLNEQEIKDVEEKLATIKQLELESIGQNSSEIEYAKNEFNQRIKNMDINAATELLQEKAKLREEERVAITSSYDTNIDILKEKMATATGEEKTALALQIYEAEQARDKKLQTNEDLYNNYLKLAAEKYPELANTINKYTGEILKGEDKAAQDRLNKMTSTYDGMDKVTQTGMTRLYDKTSKTWKDVYVKVDETTGQILGAYDLYSGKAGGYTDDIAKDLSKLGQEYQRTQAKTDAELKKMVGSTVNANNEIIGSNGKVVGSLSNIQNNADGTRTAITNLNGKPIQVTINENGVISRLETIKRKADSVAGQRVISYKVVGGNTQMNMYTGTSSSEEGFANVGELGTELATYPDGTQGLLVKGMSYVPEGTKIQTAQDTQYTLQGAVNKAVNQQIGQAIKTAVKEVAYELSKINNNDNAGNVTFANTYNVETRTEWDVKQAQENFEYKMQKELRRMGKGLR